MELQVSMPEMWPRRHLSLEFRVPYIFGKMCVNFGTAAIMALRAVRSRPTKDEETQVVQCWLAV